MHVIDVLLDSFTRLFRHHRYSPLEKLYSVILFIAGLSLMGSRVLIIVQAIKEGKEASSSR
jgi:hypothetical protein